MTAAQTAELNKIRRWADRLDAQWTLLGVRVGWDAVLGLVPLLGDAVSAILSLWMLKKARSMGASYTVLLRMLLNIILEFALGSLPVLGDLMDIVWRANLQNVELLEAHFGVASTTEEVSAYPHTVFKYLLLFCILAAVCYGLFDLYQA